VAQSPGSGDYEVLALCRAALVAGDPGARMAMGHTLLDLGRFADAQSHLEPFCREQPGNASAWSYLGRAREAMGDSAGAEEAYLRAVELETRGLAEFMTDASGRLQDLRAEAR
jgi:predicted Zn-dependent protease